MKSYPSGQIQTLGGASLFSLHLLTPSHSERVRGKEWTQGLLLSRLLEWPSRGSQTSPWPHAGSCLLRTVSCEASFSAGVGANAGLGLGGDRGKPCPARNLSALSRMSQGLSIWFLLPSWLPVGKEGTWGGINQLPQPHQKPHFPELSKVNFSICAWVLHPRTSSGTKC